jgi:hypothetical protein
VESVMRDWKRVRNVVDESEMEGEGDEKGVERKWREY